MVATASRPAPRAVGAGWLLLADQMEFAAQLVVHGDDGAVDIAD
jgi:hypothetical protein